MNVRKVLILLAFLFPIALIVGILISFIYSLNAHDSPHVDWLVAFALAAVISLFFVWHNRNETKDEQQQKP